MEKGQNKIVIARMAGFISRNTEQYTNKIWMNAESERDLRESFFDIVQELKIYRQ